MEISEWTGQQKVEIKDQNLNSIDFSKLKAEKNPENYDFNTELSIENCTIESIVCVCLVVGRKISLKNCKIGELNCYGTYFAGGLELINCNIKGNTNFECGVHNLNPCKFEITDCTFGGYVDFFDIYFEGPVKITNNKFVSGTNLGIYLKVPFGIPEGMVCELANNSGNMQLTTDSDLIHGKQG